MPTTERATACALVMVALSTAFAAESAAQATPPEPPVIDAIVPSTLAAGTRENVVRLIGRNFHPQATITTPEASIRIVRARIISSTLAEAVIAVRADAPPGSYQLDVSNPDGSTVSSRTGIRVYPASSMRGPLAVTGVRILTPRAWQIVAEDEDVHAQALLATSGMGTVVGTWMLDGVPFERFTQIVSGGFPVEVRSRMPIPRSFIGEHRLELAIESPATTAPHAVHFIQEPERRSALRVLSPGPDGLLDPTRPHFRWNRVPGASGYEVELRYRARGAGEGSPWTTVRRRVADPQWRPERRLVQRLEGMDIAFRVQAMQPGGVRGETTAWTIVRLADAVEAGGLRDDEPNGHEAHTPPDRPPAILGSAPLPYLLARPAQGGDDAFAATPSQVALSVSSTTTAQSSTTSSIPAITRFALSARTDVNGGSLHHQLTGDIAASHDLGDPWHGRQESRSWVGSLGMSNSSVRPELTIGFVPPSFLDGADFLSVFTSEGGVQGSLSTGMGRASYFQSARLAGGAPPTDPEITAGAYELHSADGRYLFRAATVQARARDFDGFSPAGTGTAYGLHMTANLGAGLQLLGEAALGEYEPGDTELVDARDGAAFRLAALGSAGNVSWTMSLSRTEQGFVNPANAGFTPGSISNRTQGDVSVSSTFFDRLSASATFSHVTGGVDADFSDPRTTENGASLSFALPISERISVSLGGNAHAQRGSGYEDLAIPALARDRSGIDLTVSERVGPLSLTQSINWQDMTDRHDAFADQQVLDLRFGVHGAVHRLATLSASIGETRTDAAPELGSTRSRLVSIQPVITLLESLRFTPRASLSRSTNDVLESDQRMTQYQLALRWTPPWKVVPLALEVASDWRQHRTGMEEGTVPFERSTLATIMVSWRGDRMW